MGAAERRKVATGVTKKKQFPLETHAGWVTKAKKIANIAARKACAASHFGEDATPYDSALRFEAHLELSVKLMKAGFHPTTDVGPTPILERGDGDSQFEFDGIRGLKVTPAVAADFF